MNTAEKLFWAEVKSPRATSRSLKICYALLIGTALDRGPEFWQPVNRALHERLGLNTGAKVNKWREEAWAIVGELNDTEAARNG